jgi:hypothetical protein
MEHKAYVFDWVAFEGELAPVLYAALATGECDALAAFVCAHRGQLTDPNDGEPLPEDWRKLVETWDAHQLGDLALTKYYRAADVDGLSYDWVELDDRAPPAVAAALLGEPFGPKQNCFDPGKYGSYFQTPERARESLAALGRVRWPELRPYRTILKEAARQRRGVYVTF